MGTGLICTIGGSHEPVVSAVKRNEPHFVHFICSDDSGSPKGSYGQVIGTRKVLKSQSHLKEADLPKIVVLAGLSDNEYEVHKIKELDDLQTCYIKALGLIEQVHRDSPEALYCTPFVKTLFHDGNPLLLA